MQLGSITPREHQERAVALARQEVARLRAAGLPPRVLIVGPCGSGKTVQSSMLIRGAMDKSKTSVFMASGRQLIYQKSRTLDRCEIPHAILMDGEEDRYWQSRVLVASKDTYWSRAHESTRIQQLSRDIWIVDEAHLAMGDTWMRLLPTDAVVIGLSATPVLNNGRGMGAFYKSMVVATTYSEMLEKKLLVPCRVFAPWAMDARSLTSTRRDGDISWAAAEKKFNVKTLTGKIVETWIKHGEDRPTACFAQGVQHSIGLCEEFRNAGIPARHIDADTPQDEREAAFEAVENGKCKILCNFNVLTTGFDLPILSCEILAFYTDSLRKYLQATGRVLRTYPGKDDSLILDHGDNVRRHLWPTHDHQWDLNPDEEVELRDLKERKEKGEREPICCPKCGAMRETGRVCTNCGHKHEKSGVKVINEDGKLEEIQPKDAALAKEKPPEQKVWMQCLAIAAHKGGSFYQAQALYRLKTKKNPVGVNPWPQEHQWGLKVSVVFPKFIRRKGHGVPKATD